jgi:predicted lipoprotein with Yx(FWY)xxD motif
MGFGRRIRTRSVGVVAPLGVALLVAACGSSSKPSSSASAAPSAPASSTSTAGVSVSTAKSSLGTYLVGPAGRALYIWVADTSGKSSCSGACAAAWPPLTTKGSPTGTGGVVSADLSTITRSDGTMQVTYKGRPLYYFSQDTTAGDTSGNGSNQFGAKWWLIAPSGGQVGATASAKQATPTSSSGAASTSSSSGSSSGGSSSGSSWG